MLIIHPNYKSYLNYQSYKNYRISPPSRLISIEVHEFVGVAEVGEDAAETVVRDNERGCVVVGMKTQPLSLVKIAVKDEMHMVVGVVEQTEKRHRARCHAEVFLHPCFRRKRESPLLQLVLHFMHRKGMVPVENHKVMAVPFMVAQKKILAMAHIAGIGDIFQRLLNRGRCRMLDAFIIDSCIPQIFKHLFFPVHFPFLQKCSL